MIKLFADTAKPEEIKYCFGRQVDDGITTNPKIMEMAGINDFEAACKSILEKYPHVPVSLETDLRGILVSDIHDNPEKVKDILLQQAYNLNSLATNVIIKIPISEGGILATRELSSKGVRTNVTACMTPYQAIQAANAGASYVSLFSNRMLDSHILELSGHSLDEILADKDWKKVVEENKAKYLETAWLKTLAQIGYVAKKLENSKTELIVGSIRSPQDIYRISEAEPHIITIPYKIVTGLENISQIKSATRSIAAANPAAGYSNSLYHPMTQYTLDEFEKAADTYRLAKKEN